VEAQREHGSLPPHEWQQSAYLSEKGSVIIDDRLMDI
tara:strand:+ start:471 stop:581 length:111 start_codon:yes stop_codon:yes gene_type:complete